jgi:hypothetical protein
MENRQKAVTHFINLLQACEAGIKEFQEQFSKDPLHALNWGDSVFKDTASADITRMVLYSLKGEPESPGLSIRQIEKNLERMLLNHNLCFSRSTSQCSNLLYTYKGEAIAECLEPIRYFK